MNTIDVRLNRVAQGLDGLKDGASWFDGLQVDEKRTVIKRLLILILQAGATADDGRASLSQSGIKQSRNAARAVVRIGEPGARTEKLASAPEDQLLDAYILLVRVLGIADERRQRIVCKGKCNHWWHHLEA